MMRPPASVFFAIVTSVAAALATAGCANDLSTTCTPGRQVACACGGGVEGRQICRSDGAGFGPCMGCDGDAGGASDGGRDGGPVDASTAPPDAFAPPPDAFTPPPDAFVPPVDGGRGCTWVYLDRGGPAFQPHACRPGAGVSDGMLVDPQAFFTELVAGRDPNDWETVMNAVEAELWSCGVGQQRGSGGDVRGRLFLPTAACPDASPPPGDTMAAFLGVRQLPECWEHPADVVDCP